VNGQEDVNSGHQSCIVPSRSRFIDGTLGTGGLPVLLIIAVTLG
jgi:hypothetical protein